MTWTHWAESAHQNKDLIAQALAPTFATAKQVLEVGSGTGQHVVHFAQLHPHLSWQPSEHPSNLPALQQNLQTMGLSNINEAIALDASAQAWPQLQADLVYSVNTLHIMSWAAACSLFTHLGKVLQPQQCFCVYGPFRFADRAFAPSNAAFDQYLKQQNPQSGIRDINALKEVAASQHMQLESDIEMPANNHILIWRRLQS